MKSFYNTNDRYGYGGPFEAESREALADEMAPSFSDWADQKDPKTDAEKSEMIAAMRAEYIAGLEEDEEDEDDEYGVFKY